MAVVSNGSHAPPVATTTITEVVHTTQIHPWLTTKGWITAGSLHVGDQVQQLDGTTATVVALAIIPGVQDMYDLSVSNVHTFAVGAGQFVVHNCSVVNKFAAKVGNIMSKDLWSQLPAGKVRNLTTVAVGFLEDGSTVVSSNKYRLAKKILK